MELIITKINGRFRDYSEVISPYGYCFYDKDEENVNYITKITTPIIDEQVIRNKFVLVQGNADDLNAKLMEELDNGRQ